jgi:hypothetical protein
MFPMTSATEIHKPMTGGAEVDDDAGEAGGDDDDGADGLELEKVEKEGSGGTVIGGDGSTASLIGPVDVSYADMERGWRVRSIRTRPAPI